MPALAWLACEAALCAVALTAKSPGVEVVVAEVGGYGPGDPVPPGAGGPKPAPSPRALLLGPAAVAFFLAIGCKTTVAPLGLVVLVAAGWALRRELRPVLAPLGGALALGLLAGGVWYLRNLVDHGSPLWPFVAAPWGDDRPPLIDAVSPSLLGRPEATLSGHLGAYADQLAGGLVLLVGGMVAAVANRRAAITAAATALSVLLWAAAPITGVSHDPEFAVVAISALRYLLPALACGAAALALAASEEVQGAREGEAAGGAIVPAGGGAEPRGSGEGRSTDRRPSGIVFAAAAVLVSAIAWGLVRDVQIGFPVTPAATTLVAGAVIGAVVAWLAGRLIVRVPLLATALVIALVLAIAGSGYLERHAEASRAFDPDVARFLASQPDFAEGDRPVAMAPTLAGALAGDRLTHRLTLLRGDATCARVRKAARDGYVVLRAVPSVEVQATPRVVFPVAVTARRCLGRARPLFARGGVEVYALR